MIGQTDMSMSMQRHALQCATHALETHAIRDCQSIAQSLKQVYTHITICIPQGPHSSASRRACRRGSA